MKVNDQVEIVVEYHRYNQKEVEMVTSAFSHICRNTTVDAALTPIALKISGEIHAVAIVYGNVKHFFDK